MRASVRGTCLVTLLLVACAGSSGPPPWTRYEVILQGAGEARVFFGVGHAAGMDDSDAQAAQADEQARTNLYGLLRRFALKLVQGYQNAQATLGQALDERDAEQLVRMLERTGLKGIAISERWHDDSTAYALARLRLDDLADALLWDDTLDVRFRDYFKQQAVVLHRELTAELGP